jgi:hypothetical protein
MVHQASADRFLPRDVLVLAATIFVLAVSCSGGYDGGGVQIVEMTTGSFRAIADYRAEILIGAFDRQWREDLQRLMDTVEIEIRCGAERQVVWVSTDRLTEPVCGVQLQLVEITSWRPPQARIKVVWGDH